MAKKYQRTTLLMSPALFTDVTRLAQLHDVTLNEFTCSILQRLVDDNRAVIDSFNQQREHLKSEAKIQLSLNFGD